jgi:hypothetical protein
MDKPMASRVDVAVDEKGKTIGRVYITPSIKLEPPTMDALKPFQPYTGYGSVMEWITEIRKAYRRTPSVGYINLIIALPYTYETALSARTVPQLGEYIPVEPPKVVKPLEVKSVTITYYPSPPLFSSITITLSDETTLSTDWDWFRKIELSRQDIIVKDKVYRLESFTLPPPRRPFFMLGDYVETADKTYMLQKATKVYDFEKKKYLPWRWTVVEKDKKTGETKEYEMTEAEWLRKRTELGAPRYMTYWSWERFPEKLFPVRKVEYPVKAYIPKYPIRRR